MSNSIATKPSNGSRNQKNKKLHNTFTANCNTHGHAHALSYANCNTNGYANSKTYTNS